MDSRKQRKKLKIFGLHHSLVKKSLIFIQGQWSPNQNKYNSEALEHKIDVCFLICCKNYTIYIYLILYRSTTVIVHISINQKLDQQRDQQLVAASAGPGCAWEGPSCAPKLAFTSTRPRAEQEKSQGTPRSPCLHLFAAS